MQVNGIQNNIYNPQFQGVLRIQNFKNGGNVKEIKTTMELDKGLADSALKNIFDGKWANKGDKNIPGKQLAKYIEVIRQTLGISIPKTNKGYNKIERTSFDDGYSFNANDTYKITHIREDINILD